METFKNIVKNTFILGMVGILLAAAAPTIANLLGGEAILGETAMKTVTAINNAILWEGLFLGALGGFQAAISPVADWIFDRKEAAAQKIKNAPHENIGINAPELQPSMVQNDKPTLLYTELLKKQSAQSAPSATRT